MKKITLIKCMMSVVLTAVFCPAFATPSSEINSGVNKFEVFMEDAGWCWYQNPRAILHNDQLIMGSVKGNEGGGAYIGVYDVKNGKMKGNFLARDQFDRDDHNSPVFYARKDESVLAVYARHGREKTHYTRISDSTNYLDWGDEQIIDYSESLPSRDGVTYMNLIPLRAEGKLYNFYRGFDYNPSFVISKDDGFTWEENTHFIKSEVKGRNRPYAIYVGNGIDTVHVCFTDAHPRRFGNNLYYAAFRNGKFYRANGEFIKDLEKDGPLLPSEADVVFRGSGIYRKGGHGESAPASAWNASIAIDEFGRPHLGYTLYLSNDDHRFRIASWDGDKWVDREVAYAGKCLYPVESSYTGLIALDPVDPRFVVISTDVNPTTGEKVDGQHEIYRANVGELDNITSIDWVPMTSDSEVRNIRPIVLRDGDQRVIAWNRGRFDTYLDYDLQTVGVIEQVEATEVTPESIMAIGNKVARWQIATFENQGDFRALPTVRKPWNNRNKHHELDWTSGALYAGFNEWRKLTKDPSYERWLYDIGERNAWKLHKRPYHADDHTVGQFYLSLFQEYGESKILEPTLTHFDWIMANPRTGTLEWTAKPTDAHHRWGWCDALFMAPPVWARLAKITGDRKYLEFMHNEYLESYNLLWDQEDHLFWRDSSFFEKREQNGRNLFWARGNGWVFGGLALMIPDLPDDWEHRDFYIEVFKQMATTLAENQRSDGSWSAGVLGSEEDYPIKESSGTSFFTFGLAWGVRNGILDEATYLPILLKSWKSLTYMVNEEGMLGYVQPIGAAPGDSFANYSEIYGVGAFLAAASEVYQLLAGESCPSKVTPQVYGRTVPERLDDFAFENDVIAFRAYGPAARKGSENNGFDCWLKRVSYPIVDKWYALDARGISYHQDHGEGLDNYHVGSSAGTGGTGIWLREQRRPLETYKSYEIISMSKDKMVFKLTYEEEIDGFLYGEEKTVTVETGNRLFHVKSVFFKNGEIANGLPVCVGLTTHDGNAIPFSNQEVGWIACWEFLQDSELGTAVKVDPERISEIRVTHSPDVKDQGHILILCETDRYGCIEYEAGYGWKAAGAIISREKWTEYLDR